MMKKVISAVMVAAFVMSASVVLAAKVTCEVSAIEGDTVTMTCKNADKLKVGDNVSVKAKKKKAIEGC
ncbi:selenite/tellurite reduction operon protein ExtJ [Desulfogranum marinum]|uniref:selenite/tellurite reduction operon protein ExtJ n=1 Tax=Desulfogranum marinum TaxID=453220 RepID=UPI001E35D5B3|nr:hypothetical protein [Desulfogranum marinum]